jgi:hypothetical protein
MRRVWLWREMILISENAGGFGVSGIVVPAKKRAAPGGPRNRVGAGGADEKRTSAEPPRHVDRTRKGDAFFHFFTRTGFRKET